MENIDEVIEEDEISKMENYPEYNPLDKIPVYTDLEEIRNDVNLARYGNIQGNLVKILQKVWNTMNSGKNIK